MTEKIVDKVVARGIVKRKSEDEGDLEIKQNFVQDLVELYLDSFKKHDIETNIFVRKVS